MTVSSQAVSAPSLPDSVARALIPAVDARISLVPGAGGGPAASLVLHQNGADQTAQRLP